MEKWKIFIIISIGILILQLINIQAIPNVNIANLKNTTCGANIPCESYFNATITRRVCVNNLNLVNNQLMPSNGKPKDVRFGNFTLYQLSLTGNVQWIKINTSIQNCWNAGNYSFKINATKDGKSTAKWGIPSISVDPYWYGLPVGEELLDGWSIHLWNEIDDYYINNSNDVQMSNHYDEIWAENYHEIKIKKDSTWYSYDVRDLNLSWIVNTDNLNYVNYTGTKIINVDGNNINFTLVYFLYSNETYIHIIPKFKNLGKSNVEIKYVWNLRDIQIYNTTEGDSVILSEGKFWLNNTNNITFTNLTSNEAYLHDENSGENLWFSWENLSYTYQILSNISYYNSPNILTIDLGNITLNQETKTEFKWIDAICSWTCTYSTPIVQQNIIEGDYYSHTAQITYAGTCVATGSSITAQYYDLSAWRTITGSTNLSTVNANPRTFDLCFVGICGPYTWSILGGLNNTYDTQDTCVFNSQTRTADGPIINVSAEIIPICDYINVSSSTTLSANNASCFNIISNNIIFNCANYLLNSNQTDNYTIIASGITNLTIKNCKFQGMRRGIYLNGVNYSLFDNNTFFNVTDKSARGVYAVGMYLENSYHNLINRSNFSIISAFSASTYGCFDGDNYGVYYSNSQNNTLSGSYLTKILGQKQGLGGESSCSDASRVTIGESLYLSLNSQNNTIFNCNFSSGYKGIMSDVDTQSEWTNITSNNFSNYSTYGIRAISNDYGTIERNYFDNIKDTCIYSKGLNVNILSNLLERCENGIINDYNGGRISNNIIRNIRSTNDSIYGINIPPLLSEFDNNTLYNLTYINSNSSMAIYGSYSVNMTNCNVTNVTNGIYFTTQADNSYVINSTLNASNYSVKLSTGTSNIKFINVTWNKSKIIVEGTGTFYNYYSLTLNVTDQNKIPIANVSINLTDSYGNRINETTGATGLSSPRVMLEFNQSSSAITYVIPYNITAQKQYYDLNTTLFNTTFATTYNVILNWSNCWLYNDTRHWLFIPSGCRFFRTGFNLF